MLAQQGPGWRNAKHARDWPRSLRAYAFPRIGAMPVFAVTTADVDAARARPLRPASRFSLRRASGVRPARSLSACSQARSTPTAF